VWAQKQKTNSKRPLPSPDPKNGDGKGGEEKETPDGRKKRKSPARAARGKNMPLKGDRIGSPPRETFKEEFFVVENVEPPGKPSRAEGIGHEALRKKKARKVIAQGRGSIEKYVSALGGQEKSQSRPDRVAERRRAEGRVTEGIFCINPGEKQGRMAHVKAGASF